jgi:hypothetical protein
MFFVKIKKKTKKKQLLGSFGARGHRESTFPKWRFVPVQGTKIVTGTKHKPRSRQAFARP